MEKDISFIELLKKYTTIDVDFIDTFFKNFKIGHELNFDIKDKLAADYLGTKLITLRKRLQNHYSKTKIFIENVDYIKIKPSENKYSVVYMMNYQCFERLAMSGDSLKSEAVRMYFIKLREFLTEHQKIIYQAFRNKYDLKQYVGFGCIYFFAVDEKNPNMFKAGRTADIVQRLSNYNVGRIEEIELKYLVIVKNPVLIEQCINMTLFKHKVYENKEIFQVDPEKLKKVIDDCYCQHVTAKENDKMYKEISELLGLYTYTKNKMNIKPYVLIDKSTITKQNNSKKYKTRSKSKSKTKSKSKIKTKTKTKKLKTKSKSKKNTGTKKKTKTKSKSKVKNVIRKIK